MQQNSNKAKILWLVLGMAVIFVTAFWFFLNRGYPPQNTEADNSSSQDSSSPDSSEEEAEPAQPILNFLLCGIDDTQLITDVIILAQINLNTNTATVLQIPRDSYIGGDKGPCKINSVWGGHGTDGLAELQSLVENITAIPIDYYAAITLSGFRNIVDNMGGIPITIPTEITYLPGKTLPAGAQVLTSQQAEWFIRYRAGYKMGDIGRLGAQQLFVQAFLDQIKEIGRLKMLDVIRKSYSEADTDLSLSNLITLADKAINLEAVNFFIAPGAGVMHNGYAVYNLDAAALADILNKNFRPAGTVVEAQDLRIAAATPDV